MDWSSQESAFLPQANFKMGGFRNSEAGRLNCYNILKLSKKSACFLRKTVVILICRWDNGDGQALTRLLGQAVKTSPFHGGNTGSIPVGVIEHSK